MIPGKTRKVAERHEILRTIELQKEIIKCPFIVDCKCRYRDILYCYTAKHLKCVEYQANLLEKKEVTK